MMKLPTAPERRALPPAVEGAAIVLLATLIAAGAVLPAFHAPANADEFVYLAGARRFAETGSLNAVFYDYLPLLSAPFPFQDVHAPGFVMLLGLAMRLFGPGYWTAVGLNVVAFGLSALMLWDAIRRLGRPVAARLAATCFILLPASAVLSSWVMAEVTLGASVIFALWVGVRFGRTPFGGAASGLAWGLALLVRESAWFIVPALLGLLSHSRRALVGFGVSAGLFLAFVNAPLSANRGPGGANVSKPLAGQAFSADAVFATRDGDIGRAVKVTLERGARNLGSFLAMSPGERWIFGLFGFVVAWSLAGLKHLPRDQRLLAAGIWIGFLAFTAVLFLFFIVGDWSGYRYLMAMMLPLFLLVREPQQIRSATVISIGAVVVVTSLVANASAFMVLDKFKRHGENRIDEIEYVDRYIKTPPERLVWQNGFAYGLRRFPTEVIVSLPQDVPTFKALEKAVWFDYVIMPNRETVIDDRGRYELVNKDEPQPLLRIFRRLR